MDYEHACCLFDYYDTCLPSHRRREVVPRVDRSIPAVTRARQVFVKTDSRHHEKAPHFHISVMTIKTERSRIERAVPNHFAQKASSRANRDLILYLQHLKNLRDTEFLLSCQLANDVDGVKIHGRIKVSLASGTLCGLPRIHVPCHMHEPASAPGSETLVLVDQHGSTDQ